MQATSALALQVGGIFESDRSVTGNRVLVIGKNGQIASALANIAANSALAYHFKGRHEANIGSDQSLNRALAEVSPELVINCSGFTAVDLAEQNYKNAEALNTVGPARLAAACRLRDIKLIHLSTDYVFNGQTDRPYRPDDVVDPLNVYGLTKADGELAVRDALEQSLIVRTSWIFGETGNNFAKTMLRLGRLNDEVKVVDDQFGTPTYAADLAQCLDTIAANIIADREFAKWGTYHATNAGQTTWFEFASLVLGIAQQTAFPPVNIVPVPTADYPSPARRPRYSVLDCSKTAETFGTVLPPWQDGVATCIANLASNGFDAVSANSG